MNRLAILGASGHGKVAAEIAYKRGWDSIDLFDLRWPTLEQVSQWKVVGDEALLMKIFSDYDGIFIAIGDNAIRQKKISQCISMGVNLVNLIAPSAVVSSQTRLGRGILIAEGSCINMDVSIADGVIINTGATIDHDCKLERFVHICPGVNLAGNVSVGAETFIGIGSSVIQGVNIGEKVIVGAGSVLIKDVPANVTLVGVPAMIISKD